MSDQLRLPKAQLFLICAIRFPEPVYFSIHVPFIYFMVRDFKITDEAHIGYYASLITSAFAMAQFVSGMPWGSLSDRIGRKPVALMGLLSTALGFLLFGLSKSFAWAITAKIVTGLLNGNVSILKSMLSELTEKHSAADRTRAFTFLQVTFGVASIVGSALGGFLSKPVLHYPNIFGHLGFITDFLISYPYFLPCFVAACLSMSSWLLALFFLDETLVKDPPSEEHQALLSSNETGHHYDSIKKSASFKESVYECFTPAVLAIVALYSMIAFEALFYDELLPTWSATPRETGGLGFDSKQIGTILSIAGVIVLVFQLFLLHHMAGKLGLVRLFQYTLFVFSLIALCQGVCRYLDRIPDPSGNTGTIFWVWCGLMFFTGLKSLCQTILYTLSAILINNSIEKHNQLGFINGFSQCCNAAMRTLSPAVAGYIWSRSIASESIPLGIRAYISWAILGIIGFITFFTSMRLNPADYSKPHTRS